MADRPPVVIEAAINGVTGKDRNPNVPRSPAEIADDALACMAAGAAIVHNHIDEVGLSGQEAAERYLECWRPVLEERPDALLYPTVNAGADVEASYSHIAPLAESGALRIGLADLGSVNFGGVEPDGVPAAPGFVYTNSFGDIHHELGLCAEHQLGPSLAVFEPGFVRAILAWWQAGRMPPGAMVKLYFSGDRGYLGAAFGLPPTELSLDAYLAMLDGCDLPWSASVFGGDVVGSGIARLAVERGGHLHLGLEAFAADGRQPTNVELVEEAVALCEELGRPVATPDEAAGLLGLPRAKVTL